MYGRHGPGFDLKGSIRPPPQLVLNRAGCQRVGAAPLNHLPLVRDVLHLSILPRLMLPRRLSGLISRNELESDGVGRLAPAAAAGPSSRVGFPGAPLGRGRRRGARERLERIRAGRWARQARRERYERRAGARPALELVRPVANDKLELDGGSAAVSRDVGHGGASLVGARRSAVPWQGGMHARQVKVAANGSRLGSCPALLRPSSPLSEIALGKPTIDPKGGGVRACSAVPRVGPDVAGRGSASPGSSQPGPRRRFAVPHVTANRAGLHKPGSVFGEDDCHGLVTVVVDELPLILGPIGCVHGTQ